MESLLDRLRNRRRLTEVLGLLVFVIALLTLVSLVSYSSADATWFNHRAYGAPVSNWVGSLGANLAEALLQLVGLVSFVAPLFGLAAAWWMLRPRSAWGYPRLAGHMALGLVLCVLLDLLYGEVVYDGFRFAAGGYLGLRLAGGLRAWLNPAGAMIVSAVSLMALVVLLTRFSFVRAAELSGRWGVLGGAAAWRTGRRGWAAGQQRLAERRASRSMARARVEPSSPEAQSTRTSIRIRPEPAPVPDALAAAASGPMRAEPPPAPDRPRRAPRQRSLPLSGGRGGTYVLPPLDLLNEPEPQSIESEQELLERARRITEKLREFAVNGAVVAVHPGPVVTTFEFKPEAGIKYAKITSMTDDLSLALKAESVRIARMPGRATVGIEVPNRRQETIYPRELLASERFQSSSSKLTLALGKSINGDVLTAELDRMPHLLIAGATGAGKSVGLNGMIASVLFKATPDEVRLILIDTKMIELGIYAGIPHLLVPVVTDPKQAATALRWAVKEMEQRYRKLASLGVRNLEQFNKALNQDPDRTMPDPKGGEPIPLEPLCYIVIVIDELADLMMVATSEVEEAIMRLAQMARAVGIHLIIATQRPSVDVITGTIKANFPSRVAFRVSQRVDSRTIIDQQGAEHLLGRGDMLYLATGSARLQRVHGGFITEDELHRVTAHLKDLAQPIYDDSVLKDETEDSESIDPAERDEMYRHAVRTVVQEGKCSVTLIQRRLQLGYARAARIVDMMEREGVVGPGEGSKPREILVGSEFLETIET